MKAQRKSQITNVINICIAYTIVGVIISFYDHFLLTSEFSTGLLESYTFGSTLIYNASAGFTSGLVGGFLLTTLNRKIRFKPFFYGQILGAIIFLTLFVLVSFIIAFISSYELVEGDLNDSSFYEAFKVRSFSSLHLKNLIVWGVVFQLTQFYLQLRQKFGPGNMRKMFFGKYHTPKMEPRIFMFLDLKSSTTIAEKLGESRYHQFLQDVFSDITEPISENKAEIYQYVGDEVIVSWHLNKIRNKANCIDIYFDIESEFELKKEDYLKKYGTVPKFKAGAHIGDTIVGEIGIIKRDITYSGDLLNTTARIQGRCNELNSRFLISGQLKDYLSDSINQWNINSKGFITLRGKKSKVELFSVSN